MKKLYTILSVLCFVASLTAQSYETVQKAIAAEKGYKYEKAIKYLNCALEKDPENRYLHYKLGKNLYNQNKYEEAIYHMEQAKPLMKDSMKYQFDLYHLYSVTGLNAFAKEAFIKYITLCPSCVTKDLLPGNSSNKLMYRKPVKEAELMGYETNTAEIYPYIINDNQIQVLNIDMDKSKPSNPLHFDQFLTQNFSNTDFLFYERNQFLQVNRKNGKDYGPFTLNTTLDKIYTTRWDPKSDRMMIFFSSKTKADKGDLGWSKYQQINIEIDKGNFNYIHPMLSKDEKHLIFASNQPGGLGGYDLWMGEINSDLTITNVKNLGTYVNTPGDECFPTIYDNNVIFFASNGHYGFGNLDMYAGIRSRGGRFMKTYNLGNRFNSVNDDYALFYNTKKNISFFTSNRYKNEKETSFDRIYKQSFDKINTTISVTDQNNMGISDATVSIPSENVNKQTDVRGNVTTVVSPLSMKKVVVSSNKYIAVDTILAPFENNLKIVLQRNAPADNVSFSLVSHPYEKAFGNVAFVLTNLSENKAYTGVTNESGLGNITLYADDEYKMEVPSMGFVKNNVKFSGMTVEKFFVKEDVIAAAPKTITSSTSAASSLATMQDNYNLYYESGKWEISDEADKQIQYFITALNKNPNYKLELSSYTDCQGEEDANINLSRQRLAEVKKLFFMRGAAESQMIGKFYGEKKPANNCNCDQNGNHNCSPEEMKKNRRTEVRLVK